VDCTLGYGGHAREILARLQPGGRLLGLDADPIELPKTEARLRGAGFDPEMFTAIRSNFAGLPQALAGAGLAGADCILADLGVSSMQLDDPARGFSTKTGGPLDMRMNPQRGYPAGGCWKRLRPMHWRNFSGTTPMNRGPANSVRRSRNAVSPPRRNWPAPSEPRCRD